MICWFTHLSISPVSEWMEGENTKIQYSWISSLLSYLCYHLEYKQYFIKERKRSYRVNQDLRGITKVDKPDFYKILVCKNLMMYHCYVLKKFHWVVGYFCCFAYLALFPLFSEGRSLFFLWNTTLHLPDKNVNYAAHLHYHKWPRLVHEMIKYQGTVVDPGLIGIPNRAN